LSPLRDEKTPSFKVNKKFNIWYDHGIGRGGNLIDFGILYFRCSIRKFLEKLGGSFPFQQLSIDPPPVQKMQGKSAPIEEPNRIKILSQSTIQSPELEQYLASRNIPVELARQYCRQVEMELYGKKITAIGFPNSSGGFELRNANFKGSSSPKDVSLIDHGKDQVAVFEGFFSFLSFLQIERHQNTPLTNFLVLNSLAFLEKSRDLMERHGHIHLFLDRDHAGKLSVEKALGWNSKYIDRSDFYSHHKDLNEWLKDRVVQHRQQLRQGRHL
jgi:DNA primase